MTPLCRLYYVEPRAMKYTLYICLTQRPVYIMLIQKANSEHDDTLHQWQEVQRRKAPCDPETGELPLERSSINVRREQDTWTVVLTPCQSGCQKEGDEQWTRTYWQSHRQPSVQVSVLSIREPLHLYSVHYNLRWLNEEIKDDKNIQLRLLFVLQIYKK